MTQGVAAAIPQVREDLPRAPEGDASSRHFPSVVTLLPTYRCNAACQNCCFDSNPSIRGRIPLDRLLAYVDQAADMGTVRMLVISGGEPFLLGPDLDKVVERAEERGLYTRIVSNGFWARDVERAHERLDKLPGLGELNLSTGDFHLEWVPWERVVFAARAAVERELRVVIMVERQAERKITGDKLRAHPLLAEVMDDLDTSRLIDIVESPWMQRGDSTYGEGDDARDVEAGPPVPQEEPVLLNRENLRAHKGCHSILNTLTVTPYEKLGACCGLPREEIPELDLGRLEGSGLADLYEDGRTDFLKVWLAVEGPEHILAWAAGHDPEIAWENRYGHQCEACRAVYKDDRVKAVLREHYREKVPDVLLRFAALDRQTGRAGPQAAEAPRAAEAVEA